ncbi:MAG: PAS domain-containing protein [Chloroflexi bacterium]|nr:PAS domain-containing protein [Chloroflexota bacterium]
MATQGVLARPGQGSAPGVSPSITAALTRVGLPMSLYDLAAGRLLAMNEPFEQLLGVQHASLSGITIEAFVTRFEAADVRDGALRHFNEVVGHGLIGYQAARRFVRSDGGEFDVQVWMRRLDLNDGRDLAVNIVIPVDRQVGELSSEATYAAEASTLALIVTDHEWRVEHASSDVETILGYAHGSLIGAPLLGDVHPSDAPHFLLAVTQAVASRHATIARSRLRQANGEWQETACFITALCTHEPPRLGVMVAQQPAGEPGGAADAGSLEQHLWRIGLELRAAGFLPEVPRELVTESAREFAELTSRQWEIVTRLVRGERVPEIAKAMFLSQSTVRNHLTVVYRKFGVHSQAKLLSKLRDGSFPKH